MRVLITILDNITETSMPFNEFVLYRANHYNEENQILIICGEEGELPKVEIPNNISIVYVGRNLISIRKSVRQIIDECKKNDLEYVIHLHQVQSGFLSEIAMLGTGFRKRTIFTVHSTFGGYKLHNKILSFINAFLAYRTVCVSKTSYMAYPKLIKYVKKERISTIQNGVDTERIDSILVDDRTPKERDIVDFIYVARMVPIKNHTFLVDVLSNCKNGIHFTFVGAEDPEKTIRRKAEKLGVSDRITFTGLIPRNEVFRRLQRSDFYISASTLEGLPVSVLEAMYCGLPCILSDIPQHNELGGEAIILSYEINKWVSEIEKLASLSVEERELKAKTLREYVKNTYSLRGMHEKYDSVYALY
ncbi:MAG: glycosyltransferase family 4 protein [Clostridia bacterium]|nr:glycosyltransferase family 4 protein [Clostridia bacterium]